MQSVLTLLASFGLAFTISASPIFQRFTEEFHKNLQELSTIFPDKTESLKPANRTDFDAFTQRYHKEYKNDNERLRRFAIFQQNFVSAQIQEILDLGNAKYGVTQFSDLTSFEFGQGFRNRKAIKSSLYPDKVATIPVGDVPLAVDWRKRGAVTAVKNQGWSCGACWAFSTTGSVEGQWFMKTGNLISLSEQELIDCDTIDYGCQGGNPSSGFRSLVQIGGIESEAAYPYDANTDKCTYSSEKAVAYINSSIALTKNEVDMAAWCATNGPISVGINADGMQNYVSGISRPRRCDPTQIDHAVLVVGYGLSPNDGIPYWIIKNSYGTAWGEDGYYRLFRGDSTCGVDQEPLSAVIN